jgi:hypothetical protein
MFVDTDTETERQRIHAWRWAVVASVVNEAWQEQEASTSTLQWGLTKRYVQAILAQAAWAKYQYERGVWLQQPGSHEALREWRMMPEDGRGPEPGPIRPQTDLPPERDLPEVTPESYSLAHGPDTDAMVYLVACRLRAGLPVASGHEVLARARYPWAREPSTSPSEEQPNE